MEVLRSVLRVDVANDLPADFKWAAAGELQNL